MEKYNEIFQLKDMLDEAGIEYDFHNLFDGYQIKIDYIVKKGSNIKNVRREKIKRRDEKCN